ncbi:MULTISPECIES: SufD family Fe-S cluster assembly protein [Asticcacaulis]|uniref:SufB/SufD family protein n=1 Tax=Asticcacaulis TaxID=76890 RepID=UPI001AE175C8|nr:SufD family Fe-S cluster assembly protein [Asticcacaulis sp. BE141]MBP2158193.1 Fe-S cluster assembly protein SufD [Asticcacaulis solisilvae]MDR6799238.1 Fe-S cluster assembly protein SufD [Asticcacaulis sp. BE141]
MSLTALDIFDPSSYPTRRDEEWKYSDLSRALRVVPQADDVHRLSDRIVIAAGETVVRFETSTGEAAVTHEDLHFAVGEGARLTRVVILDEPEDAVSIRRSTVETAPGSVFKQYVFSTGARFQRFETHVTHAGHGAEVEMNGAYLLKDKRHFDLTTRVNHAEINGITNQMIKGLVKDQATGVFQGRIYVERGADGTDARMRHQALILNDGAHVRAKPELEIYADDVQCAHGNTIGALDESALFFCQTRGMDEPTARALLTHAFVMPVAEAIEDEALRAKVLEFLEREAETYHAL